MEDGLAQNWARVWPGVGLHGVALGNCYALCIIRQAGKGRQQGCSGVGITRVPSPCGRTQLGISNARCKSGRQGMGQDSARQGG